MARHKHRIPVKSKAEIKKMRQAGSLTAKALQIIANEAKPGITTRELDSCIAEFVIANNAIPAFYDYHGYPANACISVNEEVIHGIPGNRKLQNGDIVSIDFGVIVDGFYGDAARTIRIGAVPDDKDRLVKITEQSFFEACKVLKAGIRLGDVSFAIQSFCEKNGYGIVREYVGHGIGKNLHEPPQIPNFGRKGTGPVIPAGAVLAIEPMVTMGDFNVRVLNDGWTVVTSDGLPSAHYENTVLVTENGCEILTKI